MYYSKEYKKIIKTKLQTNYSNINEGERKLKTNVPNRKGEWKKVRYGIGHPTQKIRRISTKH